MTKVIKEKLESDLLTLIEQEGFAIFTDKDRPVDSYCNLIATYLKVDAYGTKEDKRKKPNDTK